MDETTLRLQARVTVLEQLTVRLFSILGVEHASSIIAEIENIDKTIQTFSDSGMLSSNFTAEDKTALSKEMTKEWAVMRSRIFNI
jgi:hypothetical protein